jgi:hypothetical protein
MPFDMNTEIDAWRTLLLDKTKRNPLINFKMGRSGGIFLAQPDPGEIWHHLVTSTAPLTFIWQRDLIDLPSDTEESVGGYTLPLFEPANTPENEADRDILERCHRSPRLRRDHLLTDLPDRQLASRLTRLDLNSREYVAERGVAILYVAFGFLRWYESPDSQVEYRSPLLLVPVRLQRDSVEAPWKLLAEDDDILPNYSLAQRLVDDFRLRLPVPEEELTDADGPEGRTGYFGEVQKCVRDLPRWAVLDEAALGTFSFQKRAMWDDLNRSRSRIGAHELCRAIAGDRTVALPE